MSAKSAGRMVGRSGAKLASNQSRAECSRGPRTAVREEEAEAVEGGVPARGDVGRVAEGARGRSQALVEGGGASRKRGAGGVVAR